MIRISPIEISQTASSGVWSFNTDRISSGILKQIFVKAATATTTFDVTITDSKGYEVYSTDKDGNTATGVLNDMVDIPMYGKYTIAVSGASNDEAFTGRLLVRQ